MLEERDILKFLAGDLSEEDQSRLDAEKAADQDLANDLDLMSKIWQEADELKSYKLHDSEAAWDRFNMSIDEADESNGAKVVKLKDKDDRKAPRSRKMWTYLAVAASMAILVMAGLFFLNKDPFIIVGGDTWAQVTTLEDGSTVTLEDRNSTLIYPRTFKDKDERRIVIQGNSRVDVAAIDPEKTFFVDNYKAGVEVTGTIFVIESDTSASTLENIKGEIDMFDIKNPEVRQTLKEGQKFTFDGSEFIDENPPPPSPPLDTPGLYMPIEVIFDELSGMFPERFRTNSATQIENDNYVKLLMRPETPPSMLDSMIMQLDSTADIRYQHIDDVYHIEHIRKKE